jgi:hypothetical protein
VDAAVDLDHEVGLVAVEICDETVDDLLTPKV